MVPESGTHEIAHEPLVLADDLRLDLERLAENVAHAAEPSAQHVTIELQRIAWETVRRAFRAAENDAAAPRPRAVSTIDLARHLMRTATTMELRAWWRREVLFLESVERMVTEPLRRRSPPP